MSLFGKSDDERKVLGLEEDIKTLEEMVADAKKELAETKHKTKLEKENIQHLTRLNKEKDDVKFLKREQELIGEKQSAIAKVKDEYQDKVVKMMGEEKEGLMKMYEQILQRLPDINARLKGDI